MAKSIRGLLRRLWKNHNTVTVYTEGGSSPGAITGTITEVHEKYILITTSATPPNAAVPINEIVDVVY